MHTLNPPWRQLYCKPGYSLQAVLYLYEKNLEPLGHIQTGNIYIEGEHTCRLGGYENLLLEYRSRLHRTIDKWECLADIDVIMFGKGSTLQ